MKSKRNPASGLRSFWQKHRLSLRNRHDNQEMWYMYVSPLGLFSGLAALALVLFIIILSTVAYTPLLEFLPGYEGNRSRRMLVENIMRLDSMEQVLSRMRLYNDNITAIMEGKAPVVREMAVPLASDSLDKRLVFPVGADSVLRAQMEGEGAYSITSPGSRRSVREALELLSPLGAGVVVSKFAPREGIYGVRMAAPANSEAVAIEEGTVILSTWTPDEGYLVVLQHPRQLLSLYRHLSQSFLTAGQRLHGGEIVGLSGDISGEDREQQLFEFELWSDGKPVDPEGYIVF